MIEPFTTEQYLPCNVPELHGVDRRKKLPCENIRVGLQTDINILPMFNGFKALIKGQGIFWVDENVLDLLNTLTAYPPLKYIYNQYELDLERLNYYGILSFNPSSIKKVEIHKIPAHVKQIYDDQDFSWFCYVPSKIELDLSNICNFQCIHCSRESSPILSPTRMELEISEIKQIISDAAQLGVLSFQLMGGEPLIYKNFFDVCEYAQKVGIRNLSTSTNGWFIDDEIAYKISLYFSEIQLSLHGALENTHDAIVKKKGAWKNVANAAKYLNSAGVKVRLNFTVMEQNVSELEMMPKISRDWAAQSLRYLILSNQGRGRHLVNWRDEDRDEIGARIKKILLEEQANSTGLDIECGGFPPISQLNIRACFYGCPAGRELLYIGSDGSVSCCGVVDEYIGDIRESPILQLWHHPKMVELRKSPKCNCAYKYICAGSCVAGTEEPYKK